MCGILFSLATREYSVNQNEWEVLKELNTRRGKIYKCLHAYLKLFYSTIL